MKKILMTMAAISALSIGAPAAGQYAGGNVQGRVQQLQFQLQAGVQSGAISRREAMPLSDQLRQLTRLEWQYGRDGFSGRERADLQHRINLLRQHIRYAERTGNGRFDRDDRYSRNDRYDRYDRYDSSYSWDDRDDGRDGRWDDDRYGHRWDDDDDGYLRVGQRMSGNFGAFPAQYRSQYRDGDGSYYRYDNGNIYQVDALSHLILRVIGGAR